MSAIINIIVLLLVFAYNDASAGNCSASIAQGQTESCNVIVQHGITWTLDVNHTVGQFVNGDYYVVGETVITNISPGYTSSPRAKNGSMINPTDVTPPATAVQGYDAQIPGTYDSAKNVGTTLPLTISPGDSLVSTISVDAPADANASYVDSAAVLTCLSTAPTAGTFRPGISGTTKTLHNYSDLNLSLLKKYTTPNGQTVTASTLTSAAAKYQMVFLDHFWMYQGRNMHPASNGFATNFYFAKKWAEDALYLHLDFTDNEKEDLLIGFIQLGIDLYSNIEAGSVGWIPNGSHSGGRKWPILFAGLMLDYTPMKNVAAKSGDYLNSGLHKAGSPPSDYKYFSEDDQTFYVSQQDIDNTSGTKWVSDKWRTGTESYLEFDLQTGVFTSGDPGSETNGPWNPDTRNDDIDGNVMCKPYIPAQVGMAEWGIRHAYAPYNDDADAYAGEGYRNMLNGAPSWAGFTLAARMMGAKTLWNHDALFDYVDRYEALTEGKPDPTGYSQSRWGMIGSLSSGSPFVSAMFDTYRSTYLTRQRYRLGGSLAFPKDSE